MATTSSKTWRCCATVLNLTLAGPGAVSFRLCVERAVRAGIKRAGESAHHDQCHHAQTEPSCPRPAHLSRKASAALGRIAV